MFKLIIVTYCQILANTAYFHRWARLLKQQKSFTFYCLLTKENKRPFSVSICSKQKTNVRFLFPFAANKRKFAVSYFRLHKTNRSFRLPLVLFSICGIPETWSHGHGDMDTRRHGDKETRRQGNREACINGDMEIWRQINIEMRRRGDAET